MCNDAFKVMKYRCDACGKEELIWNSRDGLVPFSIRCNGKNHTCTSIMSRVETYNDKSKKRMKPARGMRYFIPMTSSQANELAFRICTQKQKSENINSEEFDHLLAKLTNSLFKSGNEPLLVTSSGEHNGFTF